MVRKRLLAIAGAAALCLSFVGEAYATNARADRISVALTQNKNGVYRVKFKFNELLQNDVLPGPITNKDVFTTFRSVGIKKVQFKGSKSGRGGRVIVKFTQNFLNQVFTAGSADTRFKYLVTTNCKKKCKTPTSRDNVYLNVVSPNVT